MLSSGLQVTPSWERLDDRLSGRAATQKEPGRLEEQTNRNLLKFNMGKCKSLHLGRKSKIGQALLGWGVALWSRPWGSELGRSWPWTLAAKAANSFQGSVNRSAAVDSGEGVIPLCSPLARSQIDPTLWTLSTGKIITW